MRRKTQNFVEVILLVGVLFLVAISVFTIYSNSQAKSEQLSKIKLTDKQSGVSRINLK